MVDAKRILEDKTAAITAARWVHDLLAKGWVVRYRRMLLPGGRNESMDG